VEHWTVSGMRHNGDFGVASTFDLTFGFPWTFIKQLKGDNTLGAGACSAREEVKWEAGSGGNNAGLSLRETGPFPSTITGVDDVARGVRTFLS